MVTSSVGATITDVSSTESPVPLEEPTSTKVSSAAAVVPLELKSKHSSTIPQDSGQEVMPIMTPLCSFWHFSGLLALM